MLISGHILVLFSFVLTKRICPLAPRCILSAPSFKAVLSSLSSNNLNSLHFYLFNCKVIISLSIIMSFLRVGSFILHICFSLAMLPLQNVVKLWLVLILKFTISLSHYSIICFFLILWLSSVSWHPSNFFIIRCPHHFGISRPSILHLRTVRHPWAVLHPKRHFLIRLLLELKVPVPNSNVLIDNLRLIHSR